MRGFLFGKLPAFGDFVSRGLAPPMRAWWDEWCLATLRDGIPHGAHGRVDRDACLFLNAPPFDGAAFQMVCAVSSRDRVGRVFPFVIGLSLPAEPDEDEAARLGEHLLTCLDMAGRDDVDLDALVRAIEASTGPLADNERFFSDKG